MESPRSITLNTPLPQLFYQGLTDVEDREHPHVGGNVLEGDPYTFCRNVWNYTIERFAVSSVLDLGSGIGHASHYFSSRGCKVIAVDGLRDNIARSIHPALFWDLTQSAVYCRVDLVHCHEVVEHIEERYLDNLLASLCCGKYILMTHALPGQGGYHHVNEQPTEYWVERLQARGCSLLMEDTRRVRELALADKAVYMSRSGLLFANRSW
jgi:SAM-dependent methyltransferase